MDKRWNFVASLFIEFDKLNMIPRDNCYNTINLKYLRNNSTLHFKMLDNELEKK